MKLRNIAKLIGIGVIALVMIGCGGGSSGGSTPAQPEPIEELPVTDAGNYKLVPGYDYPIKDGDLFQMHVLEAGNVLIVGTSECSFKVYDSNYNRVHIANGLDRFFAGNSEYFNPGWYYLNTFKCYSKTISVQSNVL